MPARPLLPLPNPSPADMPPPQRPIPSIRFPSQARQQEKFGASFNRLRAAMARPDGALLLREDPTSLAPERVIVFEVAGTIQNFLQALSRIEGLEFMAEYEADIEPDADFSVPDTRRGREGQNRTDQPIPGRFYLAMPDIRAMEELLSLWHRWERGESLQGLSPFKHLFAQLHSIRPWGPKDRIPPEAEAFWREQCELFPGAPLRTEIELWHRDSITLRNRASEQVRELIVQAGGQILHESSIPEISYHALLAEIPAEQIQSLLQNRNVRLALADEIMFLRPQSVLEGTPEVETDRGDEAGEYDIDLDQQPIAALLDGVPVQAHSMLAGRLRLDDPDDLQARALVARRIHGTAMASLIIHGDKNTQQRPLSRPLYVRPLLVTSEEGPERSETNRLLVDTLYRAIVRMKGSEGQPATAPSVFLVNLSLGDSSRPFAGIISPLARLLDFLSHRYSVLFLVSAGNIRTPLQIPDYPNWTQFENANPTDREKAVLKALAAARYERSILAPAESLNSITVGAHHHDNVAPRPTAPTALDPFVDSTLPNVSSALGLGHRRMIKPDLYFPGGREHIRMKASGNGNLEVAVGAPQRLYGVRAAAPDPSGQGRLDQFTLTDGTSSATALATRAAHLIFDGLMDFENGSLLADIDPAFYAVVVKALLVHGSRWNGNHELLKEVCGPADTRRHVERAENAARFLGFGIPDPTRALECTANRATLVGYGSLNPSNAKSYRLPLPRCLERVTDPRSLVVSIAWFSPVKTGHQNYRCIRFEAAPLSPPIQVLGVKRRKSQPSDPTVKRGSVFHEHFYGNAAVPFIDDGHLALRVWCKEDASVTNPTPIPYAIAVSIESDTPLRVYEEVQERLRIRPRT